jgi:hypothetical protein
MRSVASNFWALGGDGFYLFNYFGVTEKEVNAGWGASSAESLRQVGSPETLRGLDKLFRPDPGTATTYIGYNNAPGQLPVRLIDGTPVELVVGDDVQRARTAGRLEELLLRVRVTEVPPPESIALEVNGVPAGGARIRRVDAGTFEVDLAASPLVRGVNRLAFLPGLRSSGRLSSQVTGAELSVRYK